MFVLSDGKMASFVRTAAAAEFIIFQTAISLNVAIAVNSFRSRSELSFITVSYRCASGSWRFGSSTIIIRRAPPALCLRSSWEERRKRRGLFWDAFAEKIVPNDLASLLAANAPLPDPNLAPITQELQTAQGLTAQSLTGQPKYRMGAIADV